MFGGLMCVAALIAILASRGLPKREMYWTCFAASEITASILFFLMRRLNAANLGMYLLEKALLGVYDKKVMSHAAFCSVLRSQKS